MGARTKIEWTDATWNPVVGCTRVSEGCRHCYAERFAARFPDRFGHVSRMTEHGPRWTGKVILRPEVLDQPLRWRKPRRIFVNSMSDLFHDDVPIEFIAEVFDIMACATAACGKNHRHEEECWTGEPHTFQILTKRPERMMKVLSEELADYIGHYWPGDRPLCVAMFQGDWPLPNVWLGVSVENQQAADERIPWLLRTPAAVRFVSCEPLLGPVDLRGVTLEEWDDGGIYLDAATGERWMMDGFERELEQLPRIDWVIVGGESGPGARPMNPDWVRDIRDQCQAAGVPFFFKQWGEWAPGVNFHEYIPASEAYDFNPRSTDDEMVWKVGKNAAGRVLGRHHNGTTRGDW